MVDGKSMDELCEIAKFYDYLEIQPTGNNAFMLRKESFLSRKAETRDRLLEKYKNLNTNEDLQNLNRKVIEVGEKLSKPVCATCEDVYKRQVYHRTDCQRYI